MFNPGRRILKERRLTWQEKLTLYELCATASKQGLVTATVADIAESSGLAIEDVTSALWSLVRAGWLRLNEGPAVAWTPQVPA